MSLSTPSAPGKKSFLDTPVTIDFNDPSTTHDRVLIVEGKNFYVNSGHLSLFSEFFNGLFNANFMETEQEEIELGEIDANDFENFLHALHPEKFAVTQENLHGLMMLSGRFLCPNVWSRCMAFLRNKGKFKKIQMVELLDWSKGCDSTELKTMIEKELMSDKLNPSTERESFGSMEEKVELAIQHGLDNYKAFLEKKLIEFVNDNDMESLMKFALVKGMNLLKDKIEMTLIDILATRKVTSSTTIATVFKDVYVTNLSNLKIKIKDMLSSQIKLFVEPIPDSFLDAVFNRRSPTSARPISEAILTELFEEEEYQKDSCFNYLKIGEEYQLEHLNWSVANFLRNMIGAQDSLDDFRFVLDANKQFPYLGLKKKVDMTIDEKFCSESEKQEVFDKYLELINQYSLDMLKKSMEGFMLALLKNMKVDANKIESIISYAWKTDNKMLKKSMEEYFIAEFQITKDFKLLQYTSDYEMLEFKNSVADFLKTVSMEEPIVNTAKGTILELPSEIQLFLFHSLLK